MINIFYISLSWFLKIIIVIGFGLVSSCWEADRFHLAEPVNEQYITTNSLLFATQKKVQSCWLKMTIIHS